MPRFQYRGSDAEGRVAAGELDARDLDDARRQLTARGLAIEQLDAADALAADMTLAPGAVRLTSADAEEIVAQLAEIGAAQIPLAVGLRAAARESTSRRVKQALQRLADATDQGQSLEAVTNAHTLHFPPHVGGLIAAAARTAQLGTALDELLEHHRKMREIRWSVVSAVAYPLLVFGMAAVIFLFLMLDVVPVFARMFEDFALELPFATMSLIRISEMCVGLLMGNQKWVFLFVVVASVGALLLFRFVAGAAAWRRFLGTMPLVGPIVSWSGAAAFARMLGVLLDYEIPLPKALELTSDAVRDGNVRDACRRLAVGVAEGQAMSHLLEEGRQLPATLAPFVRSGEQQGDLAGCLRLASEVFVERIGLRASLISVVSPPLVFVFIAMGIAFTVISLFMPLIALIVGLT